MRVYKDKKLTKVVCNNCGKREANVKYTETINGETRRINLCEECSKKLGIGQIDFNMPFDFTGFFDDFMELGGCVHELSME